jgi:prolyl-tRNA synthetase
VIGVMIMIHGDNKGLVLPPRVAPTQVVIVPVGISVKTTEDDKASLYAQIHAIASTLRDTAGLRVHVDDRDLYSPGYKFNDWELRGVPLRLEIGPGELKGDFVTTARRDTGAKDKIPIAELAARVPALLDAVQADLFARADEALRAHVKRVTEWSAFVPLLNEKNVILMPHCLSEGCEDQVKELSARKDADDDTPEDARAPSMGAKSLCIPFEQPEGIVKGETKCTNPHCEKKAEAWCLFGRKSSFLLILFLPFFCAVCLRRRPFVPWLIILRQLQEVTSCSSLPSLLGLGWETTKRRSSGDAFFSLWKLNGIIQICLSFAAPLDK